MNRLRDIVPAQFQLEGEKVRIDDILGKLITVTDWSIRPSKR